MLELQGNTSETDLTKLYKTFVGLITFTVFTKIVNFYPISYF